MADTRTTADRDPQTNVRLGAEADRILAELVEDLSASDPLGRTVRPVDVLRLALRELQRKRRGRRRPPDATSR